jgi:hypothetical protein
VTTTAFVVLLAAAASAQQLPQDFESVRAGLARPTAALRTVVDRKASGAWFRKVESVEGVGHGLRAEGVLPDFRADPRRDFVAPGDWRSGPLDRASVYIGLGSRAAEVDAGLGWSPVLGADGRRTGAYAYRIFWRAAPHGWGQPEKGTPDDLYFEPGERFVMTVTAREDGTARLDILRPRDGRSFTKVFPVARMRLAELSFKRIHSIDQFRVVGKARDGNEGHPAAPTAARLEGGRWDAVAVLTREGPRPLAVDLAVEVRSPDTDARYRALFAAGAPSADGGEPMLVVPPAP